MHEGCSPLIEQRHSLFVAPMLAGTVEDLGIWEKSDGRGRCDLRKKLDEVYSYAVASGHIALLPNKV